MLLQGLLSDMELLKRMSRTILLKDNHLANIQE